MIDRSLSIVFQLAYSNRACYSGAIRRLYSSASSIPFVAVPESAFVRVWMGPKYFHLTPLHWYAAAHLHFL